MDIYLNTIAVVLMMWALILLFLRVRFTAHSDVVTGRVIEKVTRNANAETRSGKTQFLRVEYEHSGNEGCIYECDNSFITPLYRVGDSIELAVGRNKVLIRNPINILLPPVGLFILGAGALYAACSAG